MVYRSLGRNPSLDCFHRRRSLASLGHAGPRWWVRSSLQRALGRPRCLPHSLGIQSVTLIVQRLSVSLWTCPAHRCLAFWMVTMMSLTPLKILLKTFNFFKTSSLVYGHKNAFLAEQLNIGVQAIISHNLPTN